MMSSQGGLIVYLPKMIFTKWMVGEPISFHSDFVEHFFFWGGGGGEGQIVFSTNGYDIYLVIWGLVVGFLGSRCGLSDS